MTNEFKKRSSLLNLAGETLDEVIQLIEEAGKEFPCLNCPSKDEC